VKILIEGRNCSDINECETNNGGCQHTCHNTVGSLSVTIIMVDVDITVPTLLVATIVHVGQVIG
jgi:hypothetical protein